MIAAALLLAAAAPADLRIISIDVEGGAATLYVTPAGRSLLIDTGWPAARTTPGSAERIVAAARAAGLSRIDSVVITHYHVDHVGGFLDLAKLIPIGEVIDHGPNREPMRENPTPAQAANAPATLYPLYTAALAGLKHRVLAAGQRLRRGGLELIAVNSDGAAAARPLPGGGAPGQACDSPASKAENGGEENPRSLGLLLRWGKARILSLADTTWTLEHSLVCPTNRIGRADLMFANNHGSDLSNPPALLASVRPRVVIVNNGPMKGADAAVLDRLQALPGTAIWQLHAALRSPQSNVPEARIANPGREDNHNLTIGVSRDGRITITNPRNQANESY
jgi:beta-lactamase superfamily II metal-dependent hydrolase